MNILETSRLQLRELTLADLDDLYEIFSDADAMQHYPAPFDRERTEGWIKWNQDSYVKRGFGLWAVVLKEDQTVLGDCGLLAQLVEGHTELEIGYHIKRSYWRRGFATEAALACRDYAFNVLKAERVVSVVAPGNTASRRVAEKVHTHMREFLWERNGKQMCLYISERS